MDMTKSKPVPGRTKKTLRFCLQGLHHLLWPAVCANCHETIGETDNTLCSGCWAELLSCAGADYCHRCGRDAARYAIVNDACPACQGSQMHFDAIARGGVYAKSLRKMILSFKNGRTELDSMLCFLADAALKGSGFCEDIDVFVPVPLHWTRRLARGYNQSLLLAKKLRNKNTPIITDLVRIRHTMPQTAAASPAARAANVAGAFAVRPDHRFAGRNICLVDDIKTTGATLNECAKVLKHAGAAKIFALVLAVAGQGID